MKVSSDNVKSAVIIAGVIAAAYVVYRLYGAGSSIANAVGDTVGKVKDAISGAGTSLVDTARVGGNAVRTSLGGASAPVEEDQSAAETARLGRQNGPETGWFGDNILGYYSSSWAKAQVSGPDAIFSGESGTPTYDAMGNVTGTEP